MECDAQVLSLSPTWSVRPRYCKKYNCQDFYIHQDPFHTINAIAIQFYHFHLITLITVTTNTTTITLIMNNTRQRSNERADNEEKKIQELEEELKVVGNNLQQLEVSEEKAMAREENYQKQIYELLHRQGRRIRESS